MSKNKPSVMIMMGSKSDLPTMTIAADFLESKGVYCECIVASAHRTPNKVHEIACRVEKEFDLVIAGAGLAAHLPGVMASLVSCPVIGVPLNVALQGMDSLLAIVQMPPGVPVATVGIGASKNAAILALQILSLKYEIIFEKLLKFREEQSEN